MTTPRAARLVSVPAVARMMGLPRRTAFRWIQRAAKEDGGDWLTRVGPKKYLVNLARLAPRYPQWFEPRFATRDELNELQTRVSRVEKKQSLEKAARVRCLSRVSALEAFLSKGHLGPSWANVDASLRGAGT